MNCRTAFFAATIAAAAVIGTIGWSEDVAAQTDDVRIGVVLPLSGAFAIAGQNVRRGYDLAAEEINEGGGIEALGGAQIELVYADNQGRQDIAIGETERLIQDENVSAIMGSWHSPSTIAGTQAAERHRTPWIIEVASADVILERGFNYVTRVNVKGSWYGEAPVDFLDYANDALGQNISRVAIMYTDDDWGHAAVGKGTKDALIARGYEVVEEIAYPSATQDVTTYINRVRAADPDAFVVTSFPNDALLVARSIEQLGLRVPITIGVSAGYVLPTFISNLGPAAERWFVVGGWNTDIPDAAPLADRFRAKYDVDMTEHSTLAYQTLLVLKEAIEQAGSADREAINDALHAIQIEPGALLVMPYEKIEFDSTGQNPHARLLMLQVRDGKFVTVWPDEYAPAKPELPFR